jgi:hypothetical protein
MELLFQEKQPSGYGMMFQCDEFSLFAGDDVFKVRAHSGSPTRGAVPAGVAQQQLRRGMLMVGMCRRPLST